MASGLKDLLNGGWSKFKRNSTLDAIYAVSVETFGTYNLFGGRARTRWAVAGILSNYLVASGKSVQIASLNELVEAHFNSEQSGFTRFIKSDFFWLRLDFTRKHSWNESVFSEVIAKRASFLNVMTSHSPLKHSLFEIKMIDISGVEEA